LHANYLALAARQAPQVLRAGDTYRATPVKNLQISAYVQQAALALGVEGPCNFQLRLDGEQSKIFEINCRFSGTTPFCAQLGFNPVEYYIKHDRRIPYQYNLRYDVTILRYWAEVMVRNEDIAILDQNRNIVPSYLTKSRL
jgi:carbamoyl-phosphate synthase large subunit